MKKTIIFLLFCCLNSINAIDISSLEFINQDISDILIAVSEVSGYSILTDGTVSGSATYRFNQTSIDDALYEFAKTYNLYIERENSVWVFSKLEIHEGSEGISIHANDVSSKTILQELSKETNQMISFHHVQHRDISIHAEASEIETILQFIALSLGDYEVITHDRYYEIAKKVYQQQEIWNNTPTPTHQIEYNTLGYSIDIEQIYINDLLHDLCEEAGLEYVNLMQRNAVLTDLRYTEKPIDELLSMIGALSKMGYQYRDGIYYFYDIDSLGTGELLQTVKIPIKNYAVQEFTQILPSELLQQVSYRVDRLSNSLIISGYPEEIQNLIMGIPIIDTELEELELIHYPLDFITPQQVSTLLPNTFETVTLKYGADDTSIIVTLAPEENAAFKDFISAIDVPTASWPYTLQYITSEDLLAHIPPGFSSSHIIKTPDPTKIFFQGTQEHFGQFCQSMEKIDFPVPQISYELLVIEHQKNSGFSWDISGNNAVIETTDSDSFLGNFGELLSIDFDIISTFGYTFALELNTALQNSQSKVLVDTTLNGLSGEQISFRNTSTYRYHDTIVDLDSGEEEQTLVVRELTSGLIIDLEGWVSGDGMITMDVGATISRRGDDGGSTVTIPTTTEKIIKSHVRTQQGNPLVISGLISSEATKSVKGIPVLRSIPLIGRLFSHETITHDETEMVLYIIPRILDPVYEEIPEEQVLDEYLLSVFPELANE